MEISKPLTEAILFAYSHGRITEGFAVETLGLDRLDFRSRWIEWLLENPDVAQMTGQKFEVNEVFRSCKTRD